VSADSTDGADGSWRTVTRVRDNLARTRGHRVAFTGASWVRMTVLGVVPGTVEQTLAIDEIDVHDLSSGGEDSLFFMGDSLTVAAFARCDAVQPSYASQVHAALPGYFPATIDGGIGGVNSSYGVEVVDAWLADNPDYHIWAIGYGTNDAWQAVPPALFERQLQAIIDRVRAASRQPVLARIPYATRGPADENVRALNLVIDALTARNGLPPGPDLYGWFKAHPQELGPDGVHPTDVGSVSINRLWYQALRSLYPAPPR
jgi:acyl-CoA thioesterase I